MNYNAVDILLVENSLYDAGQSIAELRKSRMANNLVHVQDGEEALNFLFAAGTYSKKRSVLIQPKIILYSIQLPKLNGIEILHTIRTDKRTKNIPVVILCSSNEDPDIQLCYALGVNSYIVKPLDFDRFSEAIQNIGYYWLLLDQVPQI
jgi:two-component system response regulator